MSYVNNFLLDSIFTNLLIEIVPIIIIALLVWFILSRFTKHLVQQADERLVLERENSIMLNKRFDELNERIVIIEKMLKEVE
jgi:positive regulator of sigma E activity